MARFNLEGWNFKGWLTGNKRTILEVSKVAVPAILGWLVTGNYIGTGASVLIGKFVLDMVHYYINE